MSTLPFRVTVVDDHALFAERSHQPGIGGVADRLGAHQLVAEIVERGLLAGHPGRAAPFGNRLGHFGRAGGLAGAAQ